MAKIRPEELNREITNEPSPEPDRIDALKYALAPARERKPESILRMPLRHGGMITNKSPVFSGNAEHETLIPLGGYYGAVWLCKCPKIHTTNAICCTKCGFKQEETMLLGFGFASAFVEVTELNRKYELNRNGIDGVPAAADAPTQEPQEIQWKARVKCKASNCGAEGWVEWKDRHDSKCKKCWSKTEYTGQMDKK